MSLVKDENTNSRHCKTKILLLFYCYSTRSAAQRAGFNLQHEDCEWTEGPNFS